jgi:hypothetical protein
VGREDDMGKREAALSSPSNSSATLAMSLENVEIVRRGLEAWNADDLSGQCSRAAAR